MKSIRARYIKYFLEFKKPAGTSRGILHKKETYFLVLSQENKKGIGECGIFRGLSVDDLPNYEEKLQWVCDNIQLGKAFLFQNLKQYPSIYFGLEQAYLGIENSDCYTIFPSKFTKGEDVIPINGLIWMGEKELMQKQIDEKIKQGFSTIKLKIGAIDFALELQLIANIRKQFTKDDIEIRLDANGAFDPKDASEKLKKLSEFDIHSIEQPIKAGQWEMMSYLCQNSPLDIALDEELIGVIDIASKINLMEQIQPKYIILKPSLVGGIFGCNEWISLANQNNSQWWITSALESNIGLNAIAQYTYSLGNNLPQGLGTGGLFVNNFDSPLGIEKGCLYYDPKKKWDVDLL